MSKKLLTIEFSHLVSAKTKKRFQYAPSPKQPFGLPGWISILFAFSLSNGLIIDVTLPQIHLEAGAYEISPTK